MYGEEGGVFNLHSPVWIIYIFKTFRPRRALPIDPEMPESPAVEMSDILDSPVGADEDDPPESPDVEAADADGDPRGTGNAFPAASIAAPFVSIASTPSGQCPWSMKRSTCSGTL